MGTRPGQFFSWSRLTLLLMVGVLWTLLYFPLSARYAAFAELGETSALTLPLSPVAGADSSVPLKPAASSAIGHQAFLWSEAAFHFRVTLMHAVDGYQDPAVLGRYAWQEYLEGIDQHRQYSLMMEPVLGRLFRLGPRGSEDLVGFLMVFLPLLHALLLIPLYALARTFAAPRPRVLLGAAVFAISSLAFAPLVASFFVKEIFSWVFFAFFLLGHIRAARSGGGPRCSGRWSTAWCSWGAWLFPGSGSGMFC